MVLIETVNSINIVPNTKKSSSAGFRPTFRNQMTKDEVHITTKETNTKQDTDKKNILKTLKDFAIKIANLASVASPSIIEAIEETETPNATETTCIIKPQNFKTSKGSYLWPKFLDKYINDIEPYSEQATIKAEYNPSTLNTVTGVRKTLDASNFDAPNGTVAIPATLDETLSTSGLLQCAAVAVVDKNQNLQTLIHCCPTVDGNEDLIKYILSHSKPEDLDITIVPGFYKETDATVDFLIDTIKKHAPESNLNFANFPDKDIDVVILEKGELKCGTRDNIKPTVNPMDRIVHA